MSFPGGRQPPGKFKGIRQNFFAAANNFYRLKIVDGKG
jgi:hypothetical protein